MNSVIWLFGRSGAGKTTLSEMLCYDLRMKGYSVLHLDGDKLRHGLCSDLGFDDNSRNENHRRAAEVAALAISQGIVVVASTMAPQKKQREVISSVLNPNVFWIYVSASLQACMDRDPKGLYQRARGKGNPLDYEFESPDDTEVNLIVKTDSLTKEECSQQMIQCVDAYLKKLTN